MPLLSIIVPVYNEESKLHKIVELIMGSPCPIEREWLFIDDGSTDNSAKILDSFRARHGFRLIRQEVNQGKGAAVAAGIRESKGDIIMIQDADFEYDPADIPALLRPILDDKADVVFGSRFKKSSLQVHRTYHYFVNRWLTLISNLLSGLYLTDMETCYKVFRSDLAKAMNLKSRRFGVEVELTAYIAKLHVRVYEIPISYHPRTQLEGKKINWKDGFAALWHLVRFNLLTSRDFAFHTVPERYQSSPLSRHAADHPSG
jgi:glycosyltransferase involved in cell wall biosynthesis